jgi:hypothetical protein
MKRNRPGWLTLASLSLLATTAPARAQSGAVVQPTPSASVETLNRNLTRLSANPRDLDALVGAGDAAFEMGDVQAARGFYTRANIIDAANARAKLGLARVALQMKNGREAAGYFDEVERSGQIGGGGAWLGERAFAYDLAGWQDRAQRDYAQALRSSPSDPLLIRRYAVSLGISGKLPEAEKQLHPLLLATDRAAWRDRAFILAMNGRDDEARKITRTVMPRQLADAIDPYMRRMAALTPAQKAAAVFFGQFPTDLTRMAAASPAPAPAPVSQPARPADSRRKRVPASVPPPVQTVPDDLQPPPYEEGPDESPAPPASVAASSPAPATPSAPAAAPLPNAATPRPPAPRPQVLASAPAAQRPLDPQPQPQRLPVASAPAPRPQVLASAPAAQRPLDPQPQPQRLPVASAPAPAAAVAPPPPAVGSSLAAIMAQIEVPESERQSSAVDLDEVARLQAEQRKAQRLAAAEKAKKDAAAKARAEAEAKAKAEAEEKARIRRNPSRYWVQIATGRNVNALGFDLRTFRRKYPDQLGDRDGYTAEWGATRRLVVGPFATAAKARALEAELKGAGADSFVWQSEAGEDVTPLAGKGG